MWFKLITILVLIFSITSCGSNTSEESNSDLNTMKVNKIFQDEIPEIYQSCHNQEVNDMFGMLTVYLLLPSRVESNQPLQIGIYGCWITDQFISRTDIFDTLKIDKLNSNKIELTLKKFDNSDGRVPAQEESFRNWHSYDINGTWEIGELEIIIQNPDNQTLRATVLVE